jgi:hypothetical protein
LVLDAVITRIDEASVAVTSPATSGPRLALVEGAQTAADKPSCVGSEGKCVSVKLRKPRMVRVATDRPAIAAVALGRSAAPTISANDAALPAVGTGRQGELAKSDQAAPNMVGSRGFDGAFQKGGC